MTGDPHRGEDLLQDCLVKLYVRWPRLAADPHAYLRRMLANGSISRWRRRRRELLTAETPDTADPTGDPAGRGLGPDGELRRALLALPDRQRAVVVLRYVEDLSEKETAAVLGCTVGSVKSHNSRAMARLRAALPERQEAAP
ncbi:SigE family RNA polymerase sigma factor [Kitasatospora sp. NPDC085895]|uniref:SigE family RNA polymerase sigma factor n=1 Tax=Kitasatospora sp. NPDC085895 TaxID=3155057 RepID=UPI00344E9F76